MNQDELNRVHVYWTPTRVLFGNGTISALGAETAALGARSTLIVTDENIKKTELVETVEAQLKQAKIDTAVLTIFSHEPTFESIKDATKFARAGRYDTVIGLGGGSCMDTAKIVAGAMTNSGDIADYIDPTDKFRNKFAPKIMIPTTAGTGSEVTSQAVVIADGYKTYINSPKAFAETSIVDPEMTLSCPPRQTAACGLDALSHVMDPMLGKEENPVRDALGLEAISMISSYLRRACYDSNDKEARWSMSIAATMAGIVLNMSVYASPDHAFAEVIGPTYKISHGMACGIALPYVMKFTLPMAAERFSRVAQAMGIHVTSLGRREAAEEAIESVKKLCKDIGISLRLRDYGAKEGDLDVLTEKIHDVIMMKLYTPKIQNLRVYSRPEVVETLKAMLDGDV